LYFQIGWCFYSVIHARMFISFDRFIRCSALQRSCHDTREVAKDSFSLSLSLSLFLSLSVCLSICLSLFLSASLRSARRRTVRTTVETRENTRSDSLRYGYGACTSRSRSARAFLTAAIINRRGDLARPRKVLAAAFESRGWSYAFVKPWRARAFEIVWLPLCNNERKAWLEVEGEREREREREGGGERIEKAISKTYAFDTVVLARAATRDSETVHRVPRERRMTRSKPRGNSEDAKKRRGCGATRVVSLVASVVCRAASRIDSSRRHSVLKRIAEREWGREKEISCVY